MVSNGAISAMRRKAGVGRTRLEAGAMSVARAWRLTTPKAAEEAAGLVASLRGVTEEKVALEAIAGSPGEGDLYALLEGREDRFGLAVLDAQAVAAIVEIQTTGRVSPHPAPPRPPTRTDGVLAADLVDRFLEVFEEQTADMEAAPPVEGFRYAMPLDDQRAIELALPEGAYLAMTLTIDFGRGAKTGTLRIAVPAVERASAAQIGAELEATLMDAETGLTAVLHRLRMPLDEVTRLQPGDLIPVPLAAVGRLSLEAPGAGVVGHARLGQMNGHRAVRVLEAGVVAGQDGGHGWDAGLGEGAPAGGFGGGLPPLPMGDLPGLG